jgi:hypothetical protein
MRRRAGLVPLALALLGLPAWPQAERTLVLAASADATFLPLSIPETRKLFLGVPLERNGVTITPILNTSDPLLQEVFLQKVTFMSSPAYQTQLVSTVFRLGGKRPSTYADSRTLLDALRKDSHAVTYLWQDQVDKTHGLKTVSVLWTGSTD